MTQIVYVSTPVSRQIYVWCMKKDGLLTLLQIVNTYGSVQPMVVHSNKKFLYVGVVRPIFGIIRYLINEYGMLYKQDTILLSGSPTYLSIDDNIKILFCASYHHNDLTMIPLNLKGTFNLPIKKITGLIKCHSVNIDKRHRKIWVPCLGEDCIYIFNIDVNVTGRAILYIKSLLKMKKYSGPRHMAFNNKNNFAYVINELNGTVTVIDHNDHDCPKIIQTLDMMPNFHNNVRWASDIHITPNSDWLYCSDRMSNTISYFKIFNNGTLRLIGHQTTEIQPRSFAIDHMGRYLIVAGQKSNSIAVYTINSYNGSLKLLSRYCVGIGPAWVTIL
ncbi:6-phosphogluconolactonase [Blochmannia endosymbiont of Camponotus (Colobopsis) obliquus]|uniref:6-phosphogluconolactonase n=1 Tax=Blochmannia endosymbiont of Camponotus (Colobopsis) obliquus TaxID=1505597 RepID=UPI00061A556D|nr:6-phosphogluconolactonase [Blochmannia endosymbiont of Camponotus (Colobopsis) obliquus]AKC60506.1 6-phosphogluconolactonase [Blochmannia endosymbiont of Camponotus (Colobopsis) obliquus]